MGKRNIGELIDEILTRKLQEALPEIYSIWLVVKRQTPGVPPHRLLGNIGFTFEISSRENSMKLSKTEISYSPEE